MGAIADDRRVAAHEGRRRRDEPAVLQREVETQVVTFDAPTPCALLTGLAEDRHEVTIRIADITTFALEQNLVEKHYAERFVEAVATQRRRQQPIREPPLAARQLPIRKPLPVHRREVPVETLVVVEGEGDLISLRVVEGREKMPSLLLHRPRDILENRAPCRGYAQGAAGQQHDLRLHSLPLGAPRRSARQMRTRTMTSRNRRVRGWTTLSAGMESSIPPPARAHQRMRRRRRSGRRHRHSGAHAGACTATRAAFTRLVGHLTAPARRRY